MKNLVKHLDLFLVECLDLNQILVKEFVPHVMFEFHVASSVDSSQKVYFPLALVEHSHIPVSWVQTLAHIVEVVQVEPFHIVVMMCLTNLQFVMFG